MPPGIAAVTLYPWNFYPLRKIVPAFFYVKQGGLSQMQFGSSSPHGHFCFFSILVPGIGGLSQVLFFLLSFTIFSLPLLFFFSRLVVEKFLVCDLDGSFCWLFLVLVVLFFFDRKSIQLSNRRWDRISKSNINRLQGNSQTRL